MSQEKDALKKCKTFQMMRIPILRPLCAKLLEPTTPEIKGWVDRENFNGKGRSRFQAAYSSKRVWL